MKKYYARQLDTEQFEWRAYLDEELLEEDGIAICGNNRLCSLNEDLATAVEKELENCYSTICDLKESADYTADDLYRAVKYHFEEAEDFDSDKLEALMELCEEYYNTTSSDVEETIIGKTLSLLKNTNYKVEEICGACQGDYNTIYYPETVSQEYIDYLTAIYFGTGTEYEISATPIESAEDFYSSDTYCAYTALWKDADIKQWLTKFIGCREEELVVLNIEDTYTTKHYTYKEI